MLFEISRISNNNNLSEHPVCLGKITCLQKRQYYWYVLLKISQNQISKNQYYLFPFSIIIVQSNRSNNHKKNKVLLEKCPVEIWSQPRSLYRCYQQRAEELITPPYYLMNGIRNDHKTRVIVSQLRCASP